MIQLSCQQCKYVYDEDNIDMRCKVNKDNMHWWKATTIEKETQQRLF